MISDNTNVITVTGNNCRNEIHGSSYRISQTNKTSALASNVSSEASSAKYV
ncbi:MAG: hypothetical protein IJ087_05820 [Eggerthellaceae bacterium]|nr:hypothetical protein [Eggerthellaceae bacterium]